MPINIKVLDFSATPGARYYTDGKYSGQEFFDKILCPAFQEAEKKNTTLIVDLDGTEGYATSFLDEAFRRLGERFSAKVVLSKLELISNEEPDWIEEIRNYISSTK